MYTQKDKERMETWQQISKLLLTAETLYRNKLAWDGAQKPMFENTLASLVDTSRVQAKLWRNPDTCQCGHLNEAHERLNGPCNVRNYEGHCTCYRFSFEPKDSIGE